MVQKKSMAFFIRENTASKICFKFLTALSSCKVFKAKHRALYMNMLTSKRCLANNEEQAPNVSE